MTFLKTYADISSQRRYQLTINNFQWGFSEQAEITCF